ncbi:MAG: hypothetical protein JST90_07175 [Bacteroidetes bacterium]|nr:hypothetical protein [Bacteroidota bacterium]
MNIIQSHPTNDTLHFHWKKLSALLPTGWEASICDNGLCFGSLVDSGMMIPIVPGDDGLMSVHCRPDTNAGLGIIQYILYEEKTSFHRDTLTWIVDASPSGIDDLATPKLDVRFSFGKLWFQNIGEGFSQFAVYDASGRLLCQDKILQSTFQYAVELPAHSVAILQMNGKSGNYSKQIIVP